MILLDDDIVANYYAQVHGAENDTSEGGYIFPCNTALPTFTLDINGYPATVPGHFMNLQPVNSTFCYGSIQSNSAVVPDEGSGVNVFGNAFLKSQFVVFDGRGPRIGFAEQK